MPRHARLDAPGALHHVIGRGIEGSAIYRTNGDREDFLSRVADLCQNGAFITYAWALLSNHFHLLVRTGGDPLAKSMRKLLTGYVVNFNRRHKRFGHLFQNRYKSIICEDEPYLLELIRYIHLNPLRASLVSSLGELKRYPWSGHSALMGEVRRQWQDVVGVLARFGKRTKDATQRYEDYVREGIGRGRRPELVGGGLVRSAGGWAEVVALRRRGERTVADERILGGGDFAEGLYREVDERVRQTIRLRRRTVDLESLAAVVVECTEVSGADLRSGSKARRICDARRLLCQVAVRHLACAGADVARFLGVGSSAVNRLAAGAPAEGVEEILNILLEPTSPKL